MITILLATNAEIRVKSSLVSLKSIEYLASKVFGFPASLNSPSTFYLTRRIIYSRYT